MRRMFWYVDSEVDAVHQSPCSPYPIPTNPHAWLVHETDRLGAVGEELFDTYDEAHAALVRRIEQTIAHHQQRLRRVRSREEDRSW